jgi:hypothetical protein
MAVKLYRRRRKDYGARLPFPIVFGTPLRASFSKRPGVTVRGAGELLGNSLQR